MSSTQKKKPEQYQNKEHDTEQSKAIKKNPTGGMDVFMLCVLCVVR
jgi:hypothetical protein